MGCIGDCRQGRDECDTPELCRPSRTESFLVGLAIAMSVGLVVGVVKTILEWL